MVELPRLQNIVSGLKEEIQYSYIKNIKRNDETISETVFNANGQKIINIMRRGKYIQFQLSRDSILVYLGGKSAFVLTHKEEVPENTRISMKTDAGTLHFVDEKNKGEVIFVEKDKTQIPSVGVDPLTKQFNFRFLYKELAKSDAPIKKFLTDQNIISGIGSKYASEILNQTSLEPEKEAKSISKPRAKSLFWNIKNILRDAIDDDLISPEEEYHFNEVLKSKPKKKQARKHNAHKK